MSLDNEMEQMARGNEIASLRAEVESAVPRRAATASQRGGD